MKLLLSDQKNISQEDKKTWQNYLKNPKDLIDKDKNSIDNNIKNKRFKFDLHGYSLNDANFKVKELILILC